MALSDLVCQLGRVSENTPGHVGEVLTDAEHQPEMLTRLADQLHILCKCSCVLPFGLVFPSSSAAFHALAAAIASCGCSPTVLGPVARAETG